MIILESEIIESIFKEYKDTPCKKTIAVKLLTKLMSQIKSKPKTPDPVALATFIRLLVTINSIGQ